MKKQDFKTSVALKSNNTSETALSNYTTHGDGFNSAIDLLEVTVISTKRKKYRFYGYNYGYILIEVVNYIEKDEFGSGIVIAGGDAPAGKVDDIKINIKDPCMSLVMDDIISKDKQNEVMSYINSVFGFNENCNMNFSSVENLTNNFGVFVSGHTSITRYKDSLIVNVQINSESNNSKEFIAAPILHEMIHGYLASQNIAQNGMEETIANSKYVDWMSAALISLFPNLSPTDANALALGGL